jgi:hypothetical protein
MCGLCAYSTIYAATPYRSWPASGTALHSDRLCSPLAPSLKHIRTGSDHCSVAPDQSTQLECQNLSDEHAQADHNSGHNGSPKPNQPDEMTEDRPEQEVASQEAPQNDNGETEGHSKPNLGTDMNSPQPNLASDLGETSSCDNHGVPPPDGSSHESHNQDVGADGTQAGDENMYTG